MPAIPAKDVKTSRDGKVTYKGVFIGSVEKTTEGTSIYSAISGNPGPARWIPRNKDGERLTAEQRTKHAAIGIVVQCSLPPTVTDMKFESTWYSDKPIVTAWVTFDGMAAGVSRHEGETNWYADSFYTRGGFCPVFSNGTGARPSRALAHEGAIKALNAAFQEFSKSNEEK